MRSSLAIAGGGILSCIARDMRISSLRSLKRESSTGRRRRRKSASHVSNAQAKPKPIDVAQTQNDPPAVNLVEVDKPLTSNPSRGVLYGRVNYFPERWNELLSDFHSVLVRSQRHAQQQLPDGTTEELDVIPPFPLFKCPFCSTRDSHNHEVGCETTAAGVSRETNNDVYTPVRMTTHLSWVHPMDGAEQRQLDAFNDRALNELIHDHLFALFPVQHSDAGEVGMYQPLRVVVIVDVANMELGSEDVVYTMLQDESSLQFFSSVPCAFVCVHEMFLPHTSKVEHALYMLSHLHPLSQLTLLYAAPRTEGGDFVAGDVISRLLTLATPQKRPQQRDRASSWDGRVVLITRDMNQKACLKMVFDDPVSHRLYATPKVTLGWILKTLREAARPC